MTSHTVADKLYTEEFARIRDAYRVGEGDGAIRGECEGQVIEGGGWAKLGGSSRQDSKREGLVCGCVWHTSEASSRALVEAASLRVIRHRVGAAVFSDRQTGRFAS